MSINKEKIVSYGNLEIIKKTIDNQENIEFFYLSNCIYNSFDKRANLFFLFNSSLFLESQIVIYGIINYFMNLTDSIIIAFNTLQKNNYKQQLMNEHIIFGLYIVFSTILDFLFGITNISIENDNGYILSQLKEDEIFVKINKIKNKYQKERRKIEELYLDKLNYEEQIAINKELQKSESFKHIILNNKNNYPFEIYQRDKYLYPDLEKSIIDYTLSNMEPLCEKLSQISQIIESEKYLLDVIKDNTPSIVNILLAQVIYKFPLFNKHYKILINARFIEKGLEHLLWKKSKVSLTEYFNNIYLENKNFGDNSPNNTIDRIPWSVLERAFNEKRLKNSYSSAEKESKDFMKIKELLKL